MSMKEFAERALNKPSRFDPTPSQRAVVTEGAIFNEACPHCGVKPMKPCRTSDGTLLSPELDSTEFRFHPSRVLNAIRTQITDRMAGNLTAPERMLICYYAFILLCDSLAANSEKLFTESKTSHQIQAFFCQCAITELIKDQLIKDPKPKHDNSRIVKPS